ncbi:MAG TPA: ABC transporter permease [Ktedonobacteraceae bacterium]|nr:ABC transporter permease [Ktedonobacteraceae bacterium]
MVKFLVKRLIGLVFVILCVTFITFILGIAAPDDPVTQLLGQHYTREAYLQIRHAYGLDLPAYQQYFNFLTGLFKLNFGYSFQYKNRLVWDILKDGLPVSLELGFWALLLQLLVGIPLGIVSAIRSNSWVDTVNMGLMLALYAVPAFILAVFVQLLLVWVDQTYGFSWPVANWGAPWQYDWADLQFKIAPILVYAATGTAYFARLARTSMMEVLRQDYVRTARAKGLRERIVVYRHALRNAMIPLVTVIGVSIGFLVTGAFFIERIFNIPGIAEITLGSVDYRDYPVIQATTVVLAIGVVLGNLLSDILYTVVDPRIKTE